MTHEIRQGYKHTPLGWIPDDWEAKQLKLCANILFSNVDKHIIEGEKEVLLCNYMDVYKNEYIFSGISFSKGTVKEAEYEKFKLKKGDVIITKDSEDRRDIAVPAYVIEDVANLICGYHLAVIRPQKKVLDGLYLSQALRSHHVNFYFQKRANGITRFGLDTNTVRTSIIPVPSLSEQQKIAEILSTWDEAIGKLMSITHNIRLRNKALSQKLLMQKFRLKSFNDQWKNFSLGEVTKKVSRRNKNLEDARIYSITNTNGFVYQSDQFSREVAGLDLANYKVIKKNEFAYNPARVNVGSIALFSGEIGIISSLYVCFKTNDNLQFNYLSEWLNLDKTKYDIIRYGEGGVRVYLWYDLFSTIKINLPSISEQIAITEILESSNRELKVHEEKISMLKEQKQGLMQKLLTGEIRVKV